MMSLRLRPREAEISSGDVSSYGLGKPSKTSILKLSKRTYLVMILAVLIVYTALHILNTPSPPSHPDETLIIVSKDEKPVKLYVYDLPHRFTYGVIEHHHGTTKNATNYFPVHQHMAEWLIFTDLLRPDSERVGSPVTRVYDPDEAELYYVPFFSSLSVLVARMGPEAYDDEGAQKAVIEWLGTQEQWGRNGGRDHVIAASDPDAYGHVIEEVVNCTMLLGGVRRDRGSLVKDVVAPYARRVNSFIGDVGLRNRDTLLFFFFMPGDRTRKTLFHVLEKEEDVVMEEGKEDLTRGMHTSKFCLNPDGDTSRLFDSIVSLCVPVIVGGAVNLPFEDVIDFTEIAVFISANDALNPGFLVSLLRTVPDHQIIEYQKHLREVKPYFEFRSETIDQIWREVTYKLPFIKMMINRQRRLVNNSNLRKPYCSCSNKTIGITECIL